MHEEYLNVKWKVFKFKVLNEDTPGPASLRYNCLAFVVDLDLDPAVCQYLSCDVLYVDVRFPR